MTVALTIGFTIILGKKLDSFLGVLGALTCTPIGFTFPALIHYKVFSKKMTKCEKFIDITIIILSLIILIFGTVLGLINWNK